MARADFQGITQIVMHKGFTPTCMQPIPDKVDKEPDHGSFSETSITNRDLRNIKPSLYEINTPQHMNHIEHLLQPNEQNQNDASFKNHIEFLVQVLGNYDRLYNTTLKIAEEHQAALETIAEQKNQIEVLTASLNQKAYTASVKQRTMAGRLQSAESSDNK